MGSEEAEQGVCGQREEAAERLQWRQGRLTITDDTNFDPFDPENGWTVLGELTDIFLDLKKDGDRWYFAGW